MQALSLNGPVDPKSTGLQFGQVQMRRDPTDSNHFSIALQPVRFTLLATCPEPLLSLAVG